MTVWRLLGALVGAIAIVGGVVSAAGHAAAPRPLLAVVNGRHPVFVHLDPSTLARSDRKQLAVGDFQGWTLSPDGAVLVLGSDHRRMRFVDPGKLRTLGELRVSLPANVGDPAWFGRRLVLVSRSWTQREHYVRTIDVTRRRVLSVRTLTGAIVASARTPEALVLLLAPEEGIGPTTVAVVPPEGAIRTVTLGEIPSGFTSWPTEEEPPPEGKVYPYAVPALAVDPAGRAFVVGSGTPVAEVDLATLAVAYHPLPAAAAPDAVRKGGADGPSRHAVWLGNGIFALSGVDDQGWIDQEGRAQTKQTAAGLALVDTRTWTSRVVDPRASGVLRSGDLVFVYSMVWDSASGTTTADGVVAYALDGTERYHLSPGKVIFVEPVGQRLIVQPPAPPFEYSIADAASGRLLRTVRGSWPPSVILPSER